VPFLLVAFQSQPCGACFGSTYTKASTVDDQELQQTSVPSHPLFADLLSCFLSQRGKSHFSAFDFGEGPPTG